METYSYNIVPYECTSGYDPTVGQYADTPIVEFTVDDETLYYMDYQHQPIVVENYGAND